MMDFRKPSRRRASLSHDPAAWIRICCISGRDVPDNLPITTRVMAHWQKEHDSFSGYVNLTGLNERDIRCIVSGVKQGKISLTINRFGHAAFYRINGILL